jgi:hypothetical protein
VQQVLGVAWFDAAQWAAAIDRWPELTSEMPADHDAYRAAIEARVRAMQPQLPGVRLVLVPVTVREIEERAAAEGVEPGSAEARGYVAADGARAGRGVTWPPGRNEPCWCTSGEKYKRCCAGRRLPVATTADPTTAEPPTP